MGCRDAIGGTELGATCGGAVLSDAGCGGETEGRGGKGAVVNNAVVVPSPLPAPLGLGLAAPGGPPLPLRTFPLPLPLPLSALSFSL